MTHARTALLVGLAALTLGCVSPALADDDAPGTRMNLTFPTFGGKQFWGDVFVSSGWRIQQNHFTGHHRLLDAGDVRQAWGSYKGCRAVFEQERKARGLTPRSRHAVVVVHGLFRSKDSLRVMQRALAKEGYEVVAVGYPSSRKTIKAHAAQLSTVLNRLEGIDRVSFVTHSLGGPVVRTALSRGGEWTQRIEVERLVMIFPPSNGAVLAELLGDNVVADLVAGQIGQELRPASAMLLPLPTCEFGVIAGKGGNGLGSLLIPGDDDGTVGVAEARLPGGAFRVLDVGHTFGMNNKGVVDSTLEFLASGTF